MKDLKRGKSRICATEGLRRSQGRPRGYSVPRCAVVLNPRSRITQPITAGGSRGYPPTRAAFLSDRTMTMSPWKTFSTWYASGQMCFAIAGVSSIASVKMLYARIEYLPNTALPLFPMNVHDQINAAPNIRRDGLQGHAVAPPHDQSS